MRIDCAIPEQHQGPDQVPRAFISDTRQTERHIDRQIEIGRQTHRQTDRQEDRQTESPDGQMVGQMDRRPAIQKGRYIDG